MVFVHAAAFRLSLERDRGEEERAFGLPSGSGYFIAFFELLLALVLITHKRVGVFVTLIFLIVATTIMITKNTCAIAQTWKDLATYKASASSVALHTLGIAILMFYVCTKNTTTH